jgi:D-glycero-D-manno-heptose 1,7-bisphosphate phosphatase
MQTETLCLDGIWCEVRPNAGRGGPALFLDRDGVVVEETEYLCRVADVAVIQGAAATIAMANRLRVPVVLVTNQAGIAHGYYGWEHFAAVQARMDSLLARSGARIDAVYACPFHPQGRGIYGHPAHPDRKPEPGMLLRAATDLTLDLKRSWLIGDKASDIEAAKRAGLAGSVHVLTGHGHSERTRAMRCVATGFEVRYGVSILAALELPLLCSD